MDIVEVNEDGEELWPWRGVVRKWCEDTGAYEIVNGVKPIIDIAHVCASVVRFGVGS